MVNISQISFRRTLTYFSHPTSPSRLFPPSPHDVCSRSAPNCLGSGLGMARCGPQPGVGVGQRREGSKGAKSVKANHRRCKSLLIEKAATSGNLAAGGGGGETMANLNKWTKILKEKSWGKGGGGMQKGRLRPRTWNQALRHWMTNAARPFTSVFEDLSSFPLQLIVSHLLLAQLLDWLQSLSKCFVFRSNRNRTWLNREN